MISRARTGLVTACAMALGSLAPPWAQTSTPAPMPAEEKLTEQKDGSKPKTLWDEFKLFSYVEMDFLKDFRGALRQEWFNDAQGVRTATTGGVTLFSTTATLQYNVWKGLFARGEYRHDNADEAVFGCRPPTGCTKKSQDTLSVSLFYKFF